MKEKTGWHWFRQTVLGGLVVAVSVMAPLGTLTVQASSGDAWLAAAELLGVAGAYTACLHEVLTLGNDARCQQASLQQDRKAQGEDGNDLDRQLVDAVMQQLTTKGVYVLDARSLPFRWNVNNNEEFNACCYPTDYISVNRGLVRGLDCNVDELAAVLGHEMTHGLRQHSAHNYAKAMAQFYGMAFLNMSTNAVNGNALYALADYSIAKNVTLPTEYEADAGGFYLMTSAGFNPGGGAAAMAHMQYFVENLSNYIQEYEPYDHPDTDKREAKLAQMLTEYSAGHVAVKKRQEIYIDGKLLGKSYWTTEAYDNTAEIAYLVAGGLAKAFHDQKDMRGWNFQENGNGRLEYLSRDRVYGALKDFVEARHAEKLLQEMVTAAYAAEPQSGARRKLEQTEAQQREELVRQQEKVRTTDKNNVRMMRVNGDVYNDLGLAKLGLFNVGRAFACVKQDDMAENYAIRGRSKAILGDYTAALADCNQAVHMDAKNAYNFLNRADVYRAQGDRQAALADCQTASKINAKIPDTYKMMAQVQDELSEHALAVDSYRQYYKLVPQATDIPREYLREIDPKAAKALDDAEKKEAASSEKKSS